MSPYQKFIQHTQLRRFTVLALIVFVLWLSRSVISMILLTFIFSFLIIRLVRFIQKFIPIKPWVIVVPIYILIVFLLYLAITHYVPELVKQSIKMGNQVFKFYESPKFDSNQLIKYINDWVSRFKLQDQLKVGISTLFDYITSIGSMGVTFVFSFILSFLYTLEMDRLDSFGQLFLHSTYGWFFQDAAYFAKKFVNTFGIVIEAQIFIALVNTTITTITLAFMKMPNLPSLALMVFFLSLIPVAGVIISVIPLSLVAFSVGGIRDVIYILILIMVIHLLEAYVLNPQFMSSRTQLPIFFTFVVLLVADWLFGTWGLIVGIPIFTFLLDILGVKAIPGDKNHNPGKPAPKSN
ncbi:hypothetical protein IV38_GL001278 [Lactobacillus selangorensis]|uniref:Permease n=1 Tax=Lactobacillus selangorensis TaxID=81857 RepID=A0A0R2FMX9_9LACO|nr:AI-2E family transporter [Lactobacillus selangorensis]KRN29062.1 hypothetical protein IV38_GL001278 [Lactobacillus selangorensis]KRN30025.1 hypothetical protein IV40_GL002054 [Lactobacillus selangorensis]